VGVLIVILIVVAAGVGIWWTWYARQKRREAIVQFGLQYGLEYSRVDPYGLLGSGFRLFRLGQGRKIENVLSGSFQGLPVKEADYAYYEESTDSKGNRTKTWHYFSVVIAEIGIAVPEVSIEKENLLTRLADHLSFHDIQFESEDFNRMFNVRAGDKEFAYKLVDARMIQWLLSTGGAFGFEVKGPSLLVWSKRRKPDQLVPLLGSSKLFRDHIPRLVWNEFGTGEQQVAEPDVPDLPPIQPRGERSGS
jgi:hypothetical protein